MVEAEDFLCYYFQAFEVEGEVEAVDLPCSFFQVLYSEWEVAVEIVEVEIDWEVGFLVVYSEEHSAVILLVEEKVSHMASLEKKVGVKY